MCCKALIIALFFSVAICTDDFYRFSVQKRLALSQKNAEDPPEYYEGVKYDEYPMVVPKKRAAILFDRLMVALQKALDEEEEANRIANGKKGQFYKPEDGMDLQRRGHGTMGAQKSGRVYWRCYFNAVTCF